jgi:hypothetical protein
MLAADTLLTGFSAIVIVALIVGLILADPPEPAEA